MALPIIESNAWYETHLPAAWVIQAINLWFDRDINFQALLGYPGRLLNQFQNDLCFTIKLLKFRFQPNWPVLLHLLHLLRDIPSTSWSTFKSYSAFLSQLGQYTLNLNLTKTYCCSSCWWTMSHEETLQLVCCCFVQFTSTCHRTPGGN